MTWTAWTRCRTCMAVHAPDWAGCVATAGVKAPAPAPQVSENTGFHVAQEPEQPEQAVQASQPAAKTSASKRGPKRKGAQGNAGRCAAYRERHSEAYRQANAERMRQVRAAGRKESAS